ncbi:MAG TPA: sigma-70 family RNA polymerase sigma factor [Candidatus Binatia bacterium]|nr:sigma-70 family RNA polymerase sigma factor [Candidatus Binatia bacterium]
MTTLPVTIAEEIFQEHKPFLWSLCYRLTGSTADADDLVQETFTRALEHPPVRTDAPWRPWLVRVAMNLGRDLLRRRKRRTYIGPWLPSPLETSPAMEVTLSTVEEESPPSYEPADGQSSTEGRYDLLESVSFAFLLALEALSPQQRAVLLLRDVFDYSVQETAEALGISEANVKTSYHRARRALQAYDRDRCIPTRTLQQRTRQALERFLTCLINQDVATIEALLTADIRAVSDGGGEFLAALRPVVGRDKVVRFYLKTNQRRGSSARSDIRMINGLPALVIEFTDNAPREVSRMVMCCDLAPDGRIKTLYSILASRKLTAVRFA